MSYNGSGTFQINTTGQPVVTGTVISSTAFNALTADLATGLSTAITKDGQTATTVRIPFAAGINSSLATDSSSTSTGSIITAGGVGIAKSLYVGTNLNYGGVTLTNAVTGTGKMVLDTSPTLVTPALGTPASGVLTNCTGVQYTGFKNRLINGGMALDQRNAGASQTITAAAALAYTVDRWYAYCTGANVTGQRIAGAYTSSQYRYQFTGAASVTAIGFGQRIEAANCFDLANTTATLSCYISNSLLTTVTWTAYYANTADTFGSLASPTVTSIATGTFTVSSTRTQYTTNISIPSAATTGIQILFTVGAQTSGTWIIDSVQLEKGSTATSFDYRPYGTELALCQRYYIKYSGNGYRFYGGRTESTTSYVWSCPLPVEMRTVPTVSAIDVTNILVNDGAVQVACTSISTAYSSIRQITQTFNCGTVTSLRYGFIVPNSATAAVEASAEL